MSDNVRYLIKALQGFAEESNAMGGNLDALPTVVEHINKLYEILKNRYEDDLFWQITKPLDPSVKGYGEVNLLCTLLKRYIAEKEAEAKGPARWHVTNDTELKGAYNGEVVVDPGCTFRLMGAVSGKVILFGDAKFICQGCLNGDVIADQESVIDYMGAINGSIERRPSSDKPSEAPGQ